MKDSLNPPSPPILSVIVPLYNEEESVLALHEAIGSVINSLPISSEVILVDDGSQDRTFDVARSIAVSNPHFRVIRFRRNYGQTPAMAAGIDNARGNILITMDGDLQNDPRDIPLFIDELKKGFDIVVGWRHKRKDKWLSRKFPSKIANWLIGKVTGVPIKDNGCSLKAYRASVIKNIPLYSEMHRFIPAMASISGASFSEIKVRHHERKFGESKYGLSRIYKVLLDLITIKLLIGFSTRPLLWFGGLAFLILIPALFLSISQIQLLLADPVRFSLIFISTGALFLCLSVFLVGCGIFAELAVSAMGEDIRHFWAITHYTQSNRAADSSGALLSNGTLDE